MERCVAVGCMSTLHESRSLTIDRFVQVYISDADYPADWSVHGKKQGHTLVQEGMTLEKRIHVRVSPSCLKRVV